MMLQTQEQRPSCGASACDDNLQARRLEIVLALVVSLLAEDAGPETGPMRRRLCGQLRLCADVPDLAACAMDCHPEMIDTAALRAVARSLAA